MDKKYTSLEHAIRNIVTETVGVTGKDKPEGTPRSFLKPIGVISPPKGAEHPGTKKTDVVLAQRGEDKVQHGLRKEEVLDEAGGVDPSKSTYKLKPMSDKDKEKLKKQLEPYIEFGKDITPILGTYRQGGRTVEAGKETAKEFEKGNYWNAAKGAAYTAGQGILTGVSAVGDVITATGVGAPVVAAVKSAPAVIRAGVKSAPALIDTVKSVVAGKKAAEIVPDAKKIAAGTAPKVTTQMTQLQGVDIKGGGVNVIQKPPNAPEPKVEPSVIKPEKVDQPTQTGSKGKKPEAESPEPQTQGNLALKPKEVEAPSAPTEKPLKFDKSGQDVVPIEAPSKVKPFQPKTMTPDEIAKEMDKLKRQQSPVVKEPPSKQSINPKEFYGKTPKSVELPANVNVKQPKVAKQPNVAPTQQPSSQPITKPVLAPAVAPAPAVSPALAPALAPAVSPALAPAVSPALAPAVASAAKLAQQKKKKEEEEQQSKKRLRLPFSFPGISSQPTGGIQGATPTDPWSAHRASEYAPNRFSESKDSAESADSQRTSIEYVARPKGVTRFGRQAEIKLKIIDENMKKVDTIKKVIADKKNSTVILKPKLKDPDMDENK